MKTRSILGVWTLALAFAAIAILIIATSDHTNDKLALILLAVPIELAFVASGLVARAQRPRNRTGLLLIIVGFSWFFGALPSAGNDYVFTAGLVFSTLFTALLAHLLLAFPTGELATRTDRAIIIAFYAAAAIGPPLAYVFDEGDLSSGYCDGPCPDNVLAVAPHQTVATLIAVAYVVTALLLALAVLVRLVQRWRGASPPLRRALAPVFATAALLIAVVLVQNAVGFVSGEAAEAGTWAVFAATLLIPLSFLYGLLRSRFGATTRRLVAELSEKRTPEDVQDVLRSALRDPTLVLGYLSADRPEYVDVSGRPLKLPHADDGRMATRVGEELIVHDASLQDQPELYEVLDAARIALERGLSLRSLAASERRASALLEALPDSMYRVAADGTFLEFRLGETARLPVDSDSLVGMNVRDVLSTEASDAVFVAMKRALEHNTVELVNYTLEWDDDPVRHLEARIVRSGDDESVAIVRDITGRKVQEQALEALAESRAALSRVAVAVAKAEHPEAVFDVVTEEVARLLDADAANLVRFEDLTADEGVIVGKWSEPGIPIAGVGTVIQVDRGPLERVRQTGRPARGGADDPDMSPRLAARLQMLGVTSLVAAPITVSGKLWGAVVVSVTGDKTFAADDEERIGEFANLVAVALANAEAREQLAGLAEGRAALSRVAVAVATATSPDHVFTVVTEEVGRLFRADAANLIRFDKLNENEGLIVGRWSTAEAVITPLGTRIELLGGAVTRVRRTGHPARGLVGDRAASEPELHERLTELGIKSYVAAPIEVSGELWGAVVMWLRSEEEFPEDAEERLVQFGKLVAVALANAQAREDLATLADEQAALSRVAVAVATGELPERLFDTVSEEVGRLFGARSAATVRYLDGEDASVIVGGWDRDGAFDRKGVRVEFRGERSPTSTTAAVPNAWTSTPFRPRSGQGWSRKASSRRSLHRSSSPGGSGAPPRSRSGRRTGSPRTPSSASGSSPGSSRSRSRTRRHTSSSPRHARASSRPPTPSAVGSSGTSTTERSSGSSRSRSRFASPRASFPTSRLPRRSCSTGRARSSRSGSRSSVSSPAGSTPRSSPTAVSRRRSRRWRPGRPCRWRSTACPASGCRSRSRRPRSTSSRSRSRTSRSTPPPRARASTSLATTGAWSSRSPTTAWAGRTRPRARGSEG